MDPTPRTTIAKTAGTETSRHRPLVVGGFVLKFFCNNLSLQKSGLQRHPIGFLGVVE